MRLQTVLQANYRMPLQNALLLFILKFAFTFVMITPAFAGPITSGGGDNPEFVSDSAWFIGPRPIRYCHVMSADFGVSSAEVSTAISKSIQTWKSYLSEWKISDGKNLESLIFNTEAMPECDGTEDLKLYFGTQDDRVIKAKTKYQNPTAFAYRTSYDPVKGWGKGFIWIASHRKVDGINPEWDKTENLVGILLHEFGHVLGCSHMPGTIMREDIADYIRPRLDGDAELKRIRLSSIDGEKSLHGIYKYQTTEFTGAISYSDSTSKVDETFRRFTGRRPYGQVSAKFVFHPKLAAERTVLYLSDQKGEFKFPIPLTSDFSGFRTGATLFKVSLDPRRENKTSGVSSVHLSAASIGFSTIRAADGTNYPVTIELNMARIGPLQIRYFHNNVRHDLFQTKFGAKIK